MTRFAVDPQADKPIVRCLIREKGVVEIAARNLGVENDFHSADTMFLDPELQLSRHEDVFARAIGEWPIGRLEGQQAAIAEDLVLHLRLRSRAVRDIARAWLHSTIATIEQAVAGVRDHSRSSTPIREDLSEAIRRIVGEQRDTGSVNIQEAVDGVMRPIVAKHMAKWGLGYAAKFTLDVIPHLRQEELLAALHTHFILWHLVNRHRRMIAGEWIWEVQGARGRPFILGDVGPLCITAAPLDCSLCHSSDLTCASCSYRLVQVVCS